MKIKVTCLFLFILPLMTMSFVFGQSSEWPENFNSRAKNSFLVNLFGDATTVSANYERIFMLNPYMMLSSKVGIGYRIETDIIVVIPVSDHYLTLPFHLTAAVGYKKHFFEIGPGMTFDLAASKDSYYGKQKFVYTIAGYRFQPFDSGRTQIRIYALFEKKPGLRMFPMGISFGQLF